MNSNTYTNLETQNNTPWNSDEDSDEDIYDDDTDIEEAKEEAKEENEIIYHTNPAKVMELYPELAGKVEQAYMYCKQCKLCVPLTTYNSVTLPSFTLSSFKTQYYIGGLCLTQECNRKQYEKELKR